MKFLGLLCVPGWRRRLYGAKAACLVRCGALPFRMVPGRQGLREILVVLVWELFFLLFLAQPYKIYGGKGEGDDAEETG